MDLHDVFVFLMNYDTSVPELFWLWCNHYNSYDKFALVEMISKKHSKSNEMFKFPIDYEYTTREHQNCVCVKYIKILKPLALEPACIVRCLEYDPKVCSDTEWLLSMKISYSDAELTVSKKIDTYNRHQKLSRRFKGNIMPEMFNGKGRLTVFGLYVCMNSEKFNFPGLHRNLDIIEIYVLGILTKYRKYMVLKAGQIAKEPTRQFKLSPGGDIKFLTTNLVNARISYTGIKCIISCVDGICQTFDDYGKVAYCGVRKLSKLFATTKSTFKLECVIQSKRNVQRSAGKRMFDEIFIITRLVSWENLNMSDASREEVERVTVQFLDVLRENNIKQFRLAAICSSTSALAEAYTKHCKIVGNNGVLFNGIYDGASSSTLRFPIGHLHFNVGGEINFKFSTQHLSPFSAYFYLKLNKSTKCAQLYVFNKTHMCAFGGEIKITLYKFRYTKCTVVKVYFSINKSDFLIHNIVYKPYVSVINVVDIASIYHAAHRERSDDKIGN